MISCSKDDVFKCAYVPISTSENEYAELTPATECGTLVNSDTLIANDNLLNNLYFGTNELAVVRFKGSIFYITKAGRTAPTIYFDNGPDYFVEGLARTRKNNKIGFIDKQLNIVIEPKYDFASPFRNGVAEVCNGCKRKYHGEHWEMVGGSWGKIDINGNLISNFRSKN
jgi:hypothetical protein